VGTNFSGLAHCPDPMGYGPLIEVVSKNLLSQSSVGDKYKSCRSNLR
jgi:hypothetical protein